METKKLKYFAKFLAVEGEIKEGDKFWNPSTSEYLDASKEMLSWNYPTPNTWKKVKLFLCSRDIQEGDEAWTIIGNCFDTYKEGYDKQYWFKIVGEISPEATYVTEGMEFDEDEVEAWYDIHDPCVIPINIANKSYLKPFKIKLKGPCGHFH